MMMMISDLYGTTGTGTATSSTLATHTPVAHRREIPADSAARLYPCPCLETPTHQPYTAMEGEWPEISTAIPSSAVVLAHTQDHGNRKSARLICQWVLTEGVTLLVY